MGEALRDTVQGDQLFRSFLQSTNTQSVYSGSSTGLGLMNTNRTMTGRS